MKCGMEVFGIGTETEKVFSAHIFGIPYLAGILPDFF
jgi:hypothetical protein